MSPVQVGTGNCIFEWQMPYVTSQHATSVGRALGNVDFCFENNRIIPRINSVWIKYWWAIFLIHYSDVIMGAMASQITSVSVVCSTVGSGTDQRKNQSSASLALVRGIHRWPLDSPHKGPVTRKVFPFDDVIINLCDFSFIVPCTIRV